MNPAGLTAALYTAREAIDTLVIERAAFGGQAAGTGFLHDSRVVLKPWGFIITGHDRVHGRSRPPGFEKRDPYMLETIVPGIFAAGDVRDRSTKQVSSAAY